MLSQSIDKFGDKRYVSSLVSNKDQYSNFPVNFCILRILKTVTWIKLDLDV